MVDELLKSVSKNLDKFSLKLKKFIATNQKKLSNLEETNLKLGLYHLRSNHVNDAIFRFRLVLLFNKNSAEAYYNLARCQYIKGDKVKAKQNLDECLRLNPNHKEAKFFNKTFDKSEKIDEIPLSVVHDFYDKFAADYDNEFNEEQGYFVPEDLCDLTYKYKKTANYMLDLGCGTGTTGFKFKQKYKNAHLHGVDISKNMLKQLQKKQHSSSNGYKSLVNISIEQYLNKTNNKFDIVIASLSLHYHAFFTSILQQIKTKLVDNGVVSLALEKDLNSKVKVSLNYGYENFCYSRSYLKEQIDKSGLKLLDIAESTIKNDRIAFICVCKK